MDVLPCRECEEYGSYVQRERLDFNSEEEKEQARHHSLLSIKDLVSFVSSAISPPSLIFFQ